MFTKYAVIVALIWVIVLGITMLCYGSNAVFLAKAFIPSSLIAAALILVFTSLQVMLEMALPDDTE